jgi:hypothetical protein
MLDSRNEETSGSFFHVITKHRLLSRSVFAAEFL